MTDDRGPMELGVRRVAELAPSVLPDSDPELVARIAAEIVAHGPITFARFMELALYDPGSGYYTGGGRGPGGGGGDFMTAPESHPIFGWAIARHLEAVWDRLGRPDGFVIREHGAGTGALAAAILEGLRRAGSPLAAAVRYQAIDAAPARSAALLRRLEAAGLANHLEPPDAIARPGVILANELLDALPVHRVVGRAGGAIDELYVAVDADAGFHEVPGPPSTDRLATRLAAEGIVLQPGQAAEICLELEAWLPGAVKPLERGELLLIDYGADATRLYRPDRGSTLRAYRAHRVHADPFVAVGRQDLTAHVDLTAVERAASAAGLATVGRTPQAAFLADLGLGELLVSLQTAPGATLEAYLAARSAVARLLDPRATGGFEVLAFGRELDATPPLPGFRMRASPGLFRRAER